MKNNVIYVDFKTEVPEVPMRTEYDERLERVRTSLKMINTVTCHNTLFVGL